MLEVERPEAKPSQYLRKTLQQIKLNKVWETESMGRTLLKINFHVQSQYIKYILDVKDKSDQSI